MAKKFSVKVAATATTAAYISYKIINERLKIHFRFSCDCMADIVWPEGLSNMIENPFEIPTTRLK